MFRAGGRCAKEACLMVGGEDAGWSLEVEGRRSGFEIMRSFVGCFAMGCSVGMMLCFERLGDESFLEWRMRPLYMRENHSLFFRNRAEIR